MTNRIRMVRSVWLAVLLLVLEVCSFSGRAAAAPALSVSQASVTVETGRTAQLLIAADALPAGARLAVSGEPGIAWSLRPDGPARWILVIRAEPRLTNEATMTVQLIGPSGERFAAAQVKVTPKPLPAADAMVQASLLLDGGELVEGKDSRGYLAITNKSEQALAVRDIVPLASDEIGMTVGPGPTLVRPRATIVRPITIGVARGGGVPRTGQHLLALDLAITTSLSPDEAKLAGRTAGAGDWSAHLLVSKEIGLSVPGLSDLQGVLQIPTLLLLPGLLAIIAFNAFLEFARPRPAGENPLSRLAIIVSPGLWVAVIMISGAIGGLYALIAQRDILYGFGIRDLVWLWFVSLALGGLAGWWAYCREKKRQKAAAAPRFAPAIAPDAFLREMVSQGEPLKRRARLLSEQFLFDLGPGNAANELWACGAIGMRAASPPDPAVLAAMRSTDPDTTRVPVILDYAAKGILTLSWQPFIAGATRVAAPQIVSTDLFVGVLAQGDILQEVP